jgi:hypothetical protein
MLIHARHVQHTSLQDLLLIEQDFPLIRMLFLRNFLVQLVCSVGDQLIRRVSASHLASIEVGDERFNIAVEFVEVDIRQYRRKFSPAQ